MVTALESVIALLGDHELSDVICQEEGSRIICTCGWISPRTEHRELELLREHIAQEILKLTITPTGPSLLGYDSSTLYRGSI